MVNPKEKKGYKWIGCTLFNDDLFEDKEILNDYEEITIYECSECNEQYDNIDEAEECCKEEEGEDEEYEPTNVFNLELTGKIKR